LESQYSDYTSNGINYQIIRKKNWLLCKFFVLRINFLFNRLKMYWRSLVILETWKKLSMK
jgi:hypothetical protein